MTTLMFPRVPTTILGVEHIPGWLPEHEAAALFTTLRASIQWEQRSLRLYGATHAEPRLTAWYGPAGYTYSGIVHAARPAPLALSRIVEPIERAAGVSFDGVLCNLYRGDANQHDRHRDDEPELEATIASLSLGAPRRFVLRQGEERAEVVLESGDLLVMREQVEHCVPRTAKRVGERINLTFRRMRG